MHYERINATLAKDQGKIFNRNGSGGYTTDLHGRKIRYYAWKDSSYGEPDGMLGINCGHHVYPFTPGIDVQRYFPYDEKENDALYQKMQHQRELERRVRRSKRECMMLETTGDTEGFAKASVTLKQREQALKQYCADEGLDYKNDRTAVVGYGRSTAAKASAAAKRKLAEQTRKRLDKSAESGIIEAEVAGQKVNITVNHEKQARHMRDAPEYLPGRSYMTITEEETQEIVIKYHGTGIITVTKAGQIKETIVLDKDVGVTVNPDTGEEETTNTIKIHYSKTGVHVVPTKRRDKNDKTQ